MKHVDQLRNNKSECDSTEQVKSIKDEGLQWYVMRDLKRTNAKQPAYIMLQNLNI